MPPGAAKPTLRDWNRRHGVDSVWRKCCASCPTRNRRGAAGRRCGTTRAALQQHEGAWCPIRPREEEERARERHRDHGTGANSSLAAWPRAAHRRWIVGWLAHREGRLLLRLEVRDLRIQRRARRRGSCAQRPTRGSGSSSQTKPEVGPVTGCGATFPGCCNSACCCHAIRCGVNGRGPHPWRSPGASRGPICGL